MTIQNQIMQAIKEYNRIIIHRHQRPDPDALGSQGGLQQVIKASFPHKEVYVVGGEVESLKFLNPMDELSDTLYEGALVIVTDTANTARIDDSRYDKGAMLIKIDHHPNLEPYGDLVWVDTTVSSASEMIYSLTVESQGKLVVNNDAARLLFAGIIGDTGRFLYNNTTSSTFIAASVLISHQFSPQEIYQTMYQNPLVLTRLKGYVLQNFEVSDKGVAFMRISESLMQKYGVSSSDAANLVHVLGDIEGIQIWVFFVEAEGEIRVRIRSNGPVINEVAQKYNGGGHPLASGATVSSWEEAKVLIADLGNLS